MLEKIRLFNRRHYLVTALIVSLFALLIAFVIIQYVISPGTEGRSDFAIVALQSILTAIIIGLVISILDKMASAEKTNTLADEIDKRLKDTLNLSLVHGFHLIHESANEIDKINEMGAGEIKWANTVIRNQDKVWEAIKKALERGVNVKLLLMHEENLSQKSRGRYTCKDRFDTERIERSIKLYGDDLRNQQNRFTHRYQNFKKDKDGGVYKGDLSIRFYKDSPGLPLFILESSGLRRAFSGFYLDSFSGSLPYIEWLPREEGRGLVENLSNFFEAKWHFAEDWDVENLTE